MRNFLLAVLLLIPLLGVSQIVNSPEVKCYNVVEKNSYTVLDNLHIECGEILLMQDNAILVIKGEITGEGTIKYGDVGDDDDKRMLDLLPQTDTWGNRYYDYRPYGDKNPKIIFESCVKKLKNDKEIGSENISNTVTVGEYIDIEYPDNCAPPIDGTPVWSDEELRKYDCVIYNAIGQKLHVGKFGNIYDVHGRVKPRFKNHMIIIRINVEGTWVVLKRIYVAM